MTDQMPFPKEPEGEQKGGFFMTKISWMYGWGRKYSLYPLAFGLACCAFEFFATGAARFAFGRWGMDLFRATPRQADLIILGVSRTGKTPTSIFLSCRKLKVANIPIILDPVGSGGHRRPAGDRPGSGPWP